VPSSAIDDQASAPKRFGRAMNRRNVVRPEPIQFSVDEKFWRRLQPFAKSSHLKFKRAMNST